MTPRGVGMLASGLVIGALGVGLATPVLVYVGIAVASAVACAWVWVLVSVGTFLGRSPTMRRDVSPYPVNVGARAQVIATVTADRATRASRQVRSTLSASLNIREQAAPELTGDAGARATVRRGPAGIELAYALTPIRRGRWPLGPAVVRTADPFGIVEAETTVGVPDAIPVWPAVTELSGTAGALMGHADRVVLGARTPAADDASLRDYRDGDDLRRVHWASSARTGTLMVRSDERAGRRPATVIIDGPVEEAMFEWTVSAAASIGLSVLESGHPVRLLGAGVPTESTRRLGERAPDAAREHLLNLTVDLEPPAARAPAADALVRAAALAHEDGVAGEVTIAVVGPLEGEALAALVPFGDAGRAWAIVREDRGRAAEARQTASALSRAGWRTVVAAPGASLTHVWAALLSAGDLG